MCLVELFALLLTGDSSMLEIYTFVDVVGCSTYLQQERLYECVAGVHVCCCSCVDTPVVSRSRRGV